MVNAKCNRWISSASSIERVPLEHIDVASDGGSPASSRYNKERRQSFSMNDPDIRQQALLDALETRILVLDGAMGTMVQQRHVTAADFGGPALEGCNENLVITRPDVILDIHRAYFEA